MEPPENTSSDHFQATCSRFTELLDPLLNIFRRVASAFCTGGISFQLHALFFWSAIAIVFMLASLHVQMSKKRKFKNRDFGAFRALTFSPKVTDHGLLDGNNNDIFVDAKFSEELQVQEALLASITASRVTNSASSSVQASNLMDSNAVHIEEKVSDRRQSFCTICLENRDTWEMFRNQSCSHTFCYDCTSQHIVAKIQEKAKTISCPGVNCKATLDSDVCRLMIPPDAVVQWDDFLIQSSIPDSQKFYCPFHDCSILLVDDSGSVIKKINCPICKRSFCVSCRVPWHSEFTCGEFQKLSAKKGNKEEVLVKSLAKKKQWQKCPDCKMYVEKSEGCSHMTCRCGHEFCYRCGAKWAACHGGCQNKS